MKPNGKLKTSLHLAVIAGVLAFIAVVAASWSTPLGTPVTRVSAAEGIFLQIDGGGGTFVFSPIMCESDNVSPLSRCATELVISNVGESDSSPFLYTIAAWADNDGVDNGAIGSSGDDLTACFNINLILGASSADGVNVGDNSEDGPLPGSELRLDETQTWGLEASVDDDNACQGASTTIIVVVEALGDDEELSNTDPGPSGNFDNPGTTTAATSTNNPAPTNEVQGIQGQGNRSTPVNEIAGVRRLPVTGSGGFPGGSGPQPGALEAVLMVLCLATVFAGIGLLRGLGRKSEPGS